MSGWPRHYYQRATAYVTDPSGRLLVFDHVDSPDVSTQVPAGGILPGERPEVAVVRELAEESGVTAARLIRKLGESWFVAAEGAVPAGMEEQVHHAYHLKLDDLPEDATWVWEDRDGGDVVRHRFRFRWLGLDTVAAVLDPIQAMWIAGVRCSLEQPEPPRG